MKLFKLTASVCAVSAAFMFAACDDSSSSARSDDGKTDVSDCSVEGGVKVASPKGGETFKVGETITVVFGSDMNFGGFGVELRFNDGANKVNLLDGSIDDAVIDGKTCNEYKIVLDSDAGVEPADDAYIYIYPYSNQSKAGKSGTFKVTE